jgi:putative transposase
MDEFESLSHSKWECKYNVVFVPKYRRKMLYGELRKHLGEILRKLAEQRECRVEEGHLLPDHVHMMLSIPPKYAVSQVIGYMKGKSAIHLARVYDERKRRRLIAIIKFKFSAATGKLKPMTVKVCQWRAESPHLWRSKIPQFGAYGDHPSS